MGKGRYRQVGHCGNRGIWSPECMLGCDPGWCENTPAENEANMERHRRSLAEEHAALQSEEKDT